MKKLIKERKFNIWLRYGFVIARLVLLLGMFSMGSAYASDMPQQKKKITGTITDENGKTLPGATIMIEGTTIGTLSDSNGKYTIESTSESQKLLFSFMGFKTQIVEIMGMLVVDIAMIPDFQGSEGSHLSPAKQVLIFYLTTS